ncbi:hypothetical protein [Novosphingobium sp.]|uniref:hypothetical protein n=1 Tax=Novosphingobium sp. TaxID=1874826 RepID=UPI003B51FAA0
MKVGLYAFTAVVAAMMPSAAMADEPADRAMSSATARARDHEAIRQSNLKELAMVRQRDAQYAEGWRTTQRSSPSAEANADYADRSRYHERAMADYAHSRARYEQDLAQWRRAVAECRQGNYTACAR